MRDFCKISPLFWTGKTGKSLRGDHESQVVALYLMTSPHSNMIGIYTLPLMYLAHETGLTQEGASKALARLSEAGFCTYEGDTELVWVHEMAKYQIGEQLLVSDKRCKGVQNELAKVPSSLIRRGFALKYKDDFHLVVEGKKAKPLPSPSEAPTKQGEGEREGEGEPIGGFDDFWNCWPKGDRKQDKAKCAEKWKLEKLNDLCAVILKDVQAKKKTRKWVDGYVEAPLVYLNNKRWEDSQGPVLVATPEETWFTNAGFDEEGEARNFGCTPSTAHLFQNGQRIEVAA